MTRSGPTTNTPDAAGARAADTSLFARLSRMFDQMHAAYQDLDALSRSQDELIERDEGDQLLELLARRQVFVDRLTELDHVFVPLHQEWERSASEAPESQRAHVRARMAAIADLASWVAHRDGAATRRLQRRRDALAEELAGLGRSKNARSAYGPGPADDGPRFQDREG